MSRRSLRGLAPCALAAVVAGCGPGAGGDGGETDGSGTTSDTDTGSGTDGTDGSGTTTDSGGDCDPGDGSELGTSACGCTINACENGVWEACTGDDWPAWCGAAAMLQSVTYCADDSFDCGLVVEACDPDAAVDCWTDPAGRIYDEDALDCTLASLRDQTPGTYGWESTLDGNYSGQAGVLHLRADGAKWARQCNWEDLGSSMDMPTDLQLEAAAYFETCLAMPEAGDRYQCMLDGLTRTGEIGPCGGGTGGPPPVGTCPDGGTAWAGSAIFKASDPVAVAQLEGIECIQGPLVIEDVGCGDVLDSLTSVRSIEGSVTLRGLQIQDLSGLGSLVSVGGPLTIENLPLATSLGGLSGVATVPGHVQIQNLPNLTDLQGLEQLTTTDKLVLRELGIVTLDGLGPVSPDELEIWDCSALTSLAGLEGVTSTSSLRLIGLAAVESLDGLNNLTSAGFLQINGTGAMDLQGLEALVQVEDLAFQGGVLVDIGPLPSLTSLGGLSVRYEPELKSLSGMSQITGLDGALSLFNVPALDDLGGLSAISSIGDRLDITQCHSLTNLQGLGALTTVGHLELENNTALVSVVGLDSLTTIVDRLTVREHPNLTDLSGMVQAPTVGGRTQFWMNDGLISLAGLEGVTAIVGDLLITGNVALGSIDALQNMQTIDGNLEIKDNVSLPTQDALDFSMAVEVTGTVDVSGNG